MTAKKRQPKRLPKRVQPTLKEKLWALETVVLMVGRLRVLLARHSIVFFAWYYMGVTFTLFQIVWAHKLLRSRRCLILGPRGHGKSEVVAKIVPLWLIARDCNVRILIVTATGGSKGLARKHAMLIRHELEHNPRIIKDFGVFYDPARCKTWQQEIFQIVRDKNLKDATLEAIGVTGSVTGGRFDFILFDDIVDPKKVNTPELMAKMLADVTGTILLLLEPNGYAWMIGTRKHFGDIYGWAIKNSQWQFLLSKAIIREPASYSIVELEEPIIREDGSEQWQRVVIEGEDHGECLWPEHKPMEDLLLERVELGTPVFSRELQNEVIDEETAMFKQVDLEQCRDESMSYVAGILPDEVRSRYVVIMHGVDPSLVTEKKHAEKTDSDYMVQIAIGLTREGRRDILAIDRIRGLSPDQVEKRIKAFYVRFNPMKCAIEKNAFGIIHAHNLIEGTDMRIHKHHTGLNKNDPYEGVPHLSALFENVKYRLPYATDYDKEITDAFIAELHAFGSDVHDDQVMAAWITEYVILRYLAWKAGQRKMQERVATVRV